MFDIGDAVEQLEHLVVVQDGGKSPRAFGVRDLVDGPRLLEGDAVEEAHGKDKLLEGGVCDPLLQQV
jgi:hypothetical protein